MVSGFLMTRRVLLAVLVSVLVAAVMAAERQWQTATWRDSKIERPKVLFGVQPRDPNSNLPQSAVAREIRTFVIETSTHVLELRQDATVDTPHIDVLPGQTVRIAIEKKTVYVKDGLGKEHKLSLRKQTRLEQ
jgi:hypothetical protein